MLDKLFEPSPTLSTLFHFILSDRTEIETNCMLFEQSKIMFHKNR